MAVRIPQYEDRLTPSGFVTPRAQGAEVSPALGRAVENLGEAGMRFASVNMAIQKREKEKAEAEFLQQEQERLRKLEAKEQADAVTEAGKLVSDATVSFQGWYNEASKNPGPNFAQQVNQKWAEVTKSVLDGDSTEEERLAQAVAGMEPYFGIRNDVARQNAQRSLTQLGQHYGLNALQVEARADYFKRQDNLETTVSNNERLVSGDYSLYDKLEQDTASVIQNDPSADVEVKLKARRQSSERLTIAALQGAIARGEGDSVVSAIMNRFGATSLSAEEVQAINATGNRVPANNQAVQPGPDLKTVKGLVTPGNIDLTNRPQVKNKDGSISTVSSFSVNVDGKEVLLTPIADDGKVLSQQQAIDKYKKDGKHLGIFETPEAASVYGKQLSADQERFYSNKQGNVKVTPLPPNVARWSTSVQKQASENGVDPNVMLWQIKVESGGNPAAINEDDRKRTGDPSIGLSQFQPKTAAAYGIDPKDPEQAIKGQALYMRDLLKMFDGDYKKALAGYNWGQGNVQKAIAKHGENWLQKSPEKVQNYVNSILTNAGRSGGGNAVSGQVSSAVTNQQQPNNAVPSAAINPTIMKIVDRLPQDKMISMLNAAQTSINQKNALWNQTFDQRVQDATKSYLDSGVWTGPKITEADFERRHPGQGKRFSDEFSNIVQLGADRQLVKTMSVQDQDRLINNYRPTTGLGAEAAIARRDTLIRAIDEVRKERNADPAGYVLRNSTSVKQAADQLTTSQNGTIEQQQAAARNYVNASTAEQQRLGIMSPRLLTDSQAMAIGNQFRQQQEGGNNSAQLMKQMANVWGNAWPQVFGEIYKDLPPVAQVVGSLGPSVDSATSALIIQTANMKENDLKAGLVTTDVKTISEKTQEAFAPLQKTMTLQVGGTTQFALLYNAAEKLAYVYAKEGASPSDAATRAYNNTIGRAYSIEGYMRVPKQYDIKDVMTGADRKFSELPKMQFKLPLGIPKGMNLKDAQAQYADGLKSAGVWVTAGDESGIILYDSIARTPVQTADGRDVKYTWAQLLQQPKTGVSTFKPEPFFGAP
jgi:hypothetical protein